MKDSFYRTMNWLHTWVGLLVCWLLLLIFFSGTLSYYRYAINLWMKPELHQNAIQPYNHNNIDQIIERGQAYLNLHAPDASKWYINFPSERKPYLSYAWQLAAQDNQKRGKYIEHIVTTDNQIIDQVRSSKGGHFFYRLHFDLHYLPTSISRWIVGFCTMFMLIALISGIVIHKRIFKDFFSFRPNKGARSWLDAHNVSSVFALPYHLMITYTGLIAIMFSLMPWGLNSVYEGGRKALNNDINPNSSMPSASGITQPLVNLTSIMPILDNVWHEPRLKTIAVINPNDSNSRIIAELNNQQDVTEQEHKVIINGTTGELVATPQPLGAILATHDTMLALHTGRFAEPILRAMFFISGILGCTMIATGTIMWAVKIRKKQQKLLIAGKKPSLGLQLVESLNLGVIAGLPLATAAFFMANRILPANLMDRYHIEINSFFSVLLLTILVSFWRHDRHAWYKLLWLNSISFAFLPILNSLTSPTNLLSNIKMMQWQLVGFDMMCLIFAFISGLAAIHLKKRTSETPKKRNLNLQEQPQ